MKGRKNYVPRGANERKVVMARHVILLGIIGAMLMGCSSSEKGAQQGATSYQGREETKKLQAADAAGYDGTAIRKSVDSALDKNDAHNQGVDKASGESKQ
jgi:hypothetical protein